MKNLKNSIEVIEEDLQKKEVKRQQEQKVRRVVAEAKNIKILSAALITRGRDNTLLTTADVFLTGFTSEKLESLIINFVEVAIFTPATSGTIGTGETTGKGVVAEKVDDIRDGCHGALS